MISSLFSRKMLVRVIEAGMLVLFFLLTIGIPMIVLVFNVPVVL